MNNKLEEFARNELKSGLSKCSEKQQQMFKRMYAHNKPELTIDEVVDQMPETKLDMAMQQVERTLNK